MLAADYMHLDSEIDKVVASGADVLHYDVMDGTFVPGITFGQGILKMVAKKPIPMDVHLMIANPIKHVREFAEAGAKYITVHQEAANFELRDTLRAIREAGCLAGVSVKPFTSVDAIADVLNEVDLILIMTVEPGKGGQKLIPFTVDKVRQVREMCRKAGVNPVIEVDGGVKQSNAAQVIEAGADVLVMGTGLFRADDPKAVVKTVLGE